MNQNEGRYKKLIRRDASDHGNSDCKLQIANCRLPFNLQSAICIVISTTSQTNRAPPRCVGVTVCPTSLASTRSSPTHSLCCTLLRRTRSLAWRRRRAILVHRALTIKQGGRRTDASCSGNRIVQNARHDLVHSARTYLLVDLLLAEVTGRLRVRKSDRGSPGRAIDRLEAPAKALQCDGGDGDFDALIDGRGEVGWMPPMLKQICRCAWRPRRRAFRDNRRGARGPTVS